MRSAGQQSANFQPLAVSGGRGARPAHIADTKKNGILLISICLLFSSFLAQLRYKTTNIIPHHQDGRKKIEDMYHVTTERSEFYTMADVHKPPVLFTPSEELEKVRHYLPCCGLPVDTKFDPYPTNSGQSLTTGDINFYSGHTPGDLSTGGFETSSMPSIAAPTPPLAG